MIGTHALELDGINDYLTISMQTQMVRYEAGGGGFTISTWIKKSDCTGLTESIFSQSASPTSQMHSLTNPNINVRYGSCGGSAPYIRINLVNSDEMWGRADALVALEDEW